MVAHERIVEAAKAANAHDFIMCVRAWCVDVCGCGCWGGGGGGQRAHDFIMYVRECVGVCVGLCLRV